MFVKKAISSTLTTMNFFKVPIRLKIKHQDFFSSRSGELFSIAIYAYLIFSLSTSDVFFKTSPQVIVTELESKFAPWYNFTEKNFFFALEITSDLGIGLPYDPNLFTVETVYLSLGNNPEQQQIITKYAKTLMVPCKDTYVALVQPLFIKTYPYSLCLSNPRFEIGGVAGDALLSTLEISLIKCNNLTSNNTCKNQTEIDNYFVSKKIAYLISDNLFATSDYEAPIIPKINVQYYNLDSRISKKQRLIIQQVNIVSDDGLYSSTNSSINSWKIGDLENDFDLNSQINLFDITLFSTKKVTNIKRTYMKIQEALSSLGGIVNVLISVGFILLHLIPYNGFDVYLSNHLFSFKNLSGKQTDYAKPMEESKVTKKEEVVVADIEFLKVSVPRTLETDRCKLMTQSQYLPHQETVLQTLEPATDTQAINKENDILENKNIIEMQKIERKLNPCLGDPYIISEENINSSEYKQNEGEKEKKNNKQMFLEHDIQKSFRKKVSLKNEELSPSRKYSRSLSKKTKKDKNTIAENFKNYSAMKEKSDVLKIEFMDLIKARSENNDFIKKIKALKLATSKIQKDLDITNIMEKFQEVDKLKLILFNKEQLMLFNLIAKPEIFVDEHGVSERDPGILISQNLKNMNERTDQNFLDLVLYYHQIKTREGEDNLEGRLIKLVDNDMKKYFEV